MNLPTPRQFSAWPLLMGAVVAFTCGIGLLEASTGEPTDVAAAAIITCGLVMLGAWIALHAAGLRGPHYDGTMPPPSPKDEPSSPTKETS
jgi:hypothetical protein